MTISNCGHDENGKYSGGAAGDQTKGEWCVRSWYDRPWSCVLRYPTSRVRTRIGSLARQAAKNEKIGYDQNQRLTFYTQLMKQSDYWRPDKITAACEADCSSGVTAIVIAVGKYFNLPKLANLDKTITTHNMRAKFKAAGFKVLTKKKYLTSDAYLKKGDILLNDEHHVCINLTNGSKV